MHFILGHHSFFNTLKHILRMVAAGAFFGTMLAGTATAQDFMTKAELLATIPGSQISGISNQDGKTPWAQAYSAASRKNTGVYNGIWDGKDKYKGEWFVDGNKWCEKGGWGQRCWDIERVSAKKLRIYFDGKPLKNTWNLR